MARKARILAALGVLLGAVTVHAAYITVNYPAGQPILHTLEEVMAMPGGLRVLDKVFSDWMFVPNQQNGALAPTPAGITVMGVILDRNDNGVYDLNVDEVGLCFSGIWSVFANQSVDTVIGFKVAADAPFLLSDNTLLMAAFGTAGNGQVSITENVYRDSNLVHRIADKFVFANILNATQHISHQDFLGGAYPTIWVVKDVGATGGVEGTAQEAATLSLFYNTFSQVPEPAAVGLLLLGAGAVLTKRRRRT